MKRVYPIILTPDDEMFLVNVPDFDIMTQGTDLANAIEMARDVICITAVDMQDENKTLPEPSAVSSIKAEKNSIVTLVDVDFDAYRRMLDNRTVKKNCTIPSWLNVKAEEAGINFSSVLREALENRLNIR
ncbi:type II toxin-antitoxin system HicB family antitoxin [Porcipelethomonas sp.]|uniref:type II toxin-antitoxin system HicB family antitoxin n=1 Tax=Porcipelethomonas sp. TaxID=2981675 RepID=UPI003EF77CCB